MNIKVCIVFAISCLAVQGFAQDSSFRHDFDDESPAETGIVDGLDIFGGSLLSSGITIDQSVSPMNSAFFVGSNLTAAIPPFKWGVFNTNATLNLSSPDITLSVDVKATTASSDPHIAFQLVDADGTIHRTADADLLAVATDFTTFSQAPSDLALEPGEAGSTPGLDLENIVQYGILYLNTDTVDENTFYIDNFRTVVELTTIDAITITNAPVIQFVGEIGTIYELQSTMDLVNSNSWVSAGFSIEGTGATQVMFDTTGSTDHKEYRVISSQ